MISFGTNTIGIGLAIHLRDKFTANARAISAQFNRLHGNANQVMEDNLRIARRMGFGMTVAGGILLGGFNKGLHAAADFGYTMKTVELVTTATNKQLKQMDELATSLGTSTIFKPQDVASAMEFLVKAGFKAEHVIGGTIQAVTYLGGALDKPIGGKGGVADYLSHIMQGFNVGPKGAMRVADMVTKTALASASDLEDIHEALKYVSSTSVDLNIGLDETLAMIAKLSNAGLRGGLGGRSLNNMLIQLSTSLGQLRTPKHQKVLDLMGLRPSDLVDSTGNLKRVVDVLAILDNRLNKMPPIERVSALNALLNLRGGRAVGPLLRNTGVGGSLSDLLKDIRGASNVAMDISTKRMATLWGSFERMGDVIWNFFRTVGEVLEPIFKPLLDLSIAMLSRFTAFIKTPLGKPLIILAAAASIALVTMGSLLVVFTSIKLLTIASTFSFGNMGKSLALAWNTGAAAALRYATVAKGAMMVNTPMGVRWRNMATGRFQGAPGNTVVAGTGMLGAGKGIMGFIKGLFQAGGALSWLGRIAKVVTGPIGMFTAILGALVGFRNILKLVAFGLATLLNSIIFAAQSIWAVISNLLTPWNIGTDFNKYKERYKKSQDNLIETLGMKKMDHATFSEPTAYNGRVKGFEEWMANKKVNDYKLPSINLTLSGRKVGEITEEERNKNLRALLETKVTN